MTQADRRLAALAAAFAPRVAEGLLRRLEPGAPAADAAARLSAEPRAVRLAALAEALGGSGVSCLEESLRAAAPAERPGVSAALQRMDLGQIAPVLARLCRERAGSHLGDARPRAGL